MVTKTPNLDMVDLLEGQKLAATAANQSFLTLDSIVQLWVADGAPSTTPPASGLTNGIAYIVPASATGDWSGHDLKVVVWQSGWTFLVPRPGWRCWDARRLRMMIFTGLHGGGGRWMDFQAARVAELTDNTTGTATTTISDAGITYSQVTINDNFATVNAQLNALMDALITAGLMTADALAAEVVSEAVAIAETAVDTLNP